MGLYFVLQGAADLIYGLVQYTQISEFGGDASASIEYFLFGIPPLLIGGVALLMSSSLAGWAWREDASDA